MGASATILDYSDRSSYSPPMAKRKNPAAVALGKRRAAKFSHEQLSDQASQSAATRLKGTTKKERSAIMRDLIAKRWAKKKDTDK